MNFNPLLIEEAESMTNKVVDQILNVNPESVTKGFYYWQGIITALAMIISAYKTIDSVDEQMRKFAYHSKNSEIDPLLLIKKQHESIISEAEYNYSVYEKLLFDLGVKIV